MDKKNNKIIHYIWYGGNPLSELTKKCIASWKKFLPDYEIMEWNEKTFDVNQCPFIKEAYEQRKWAFVADYTRFKVLEEYGGIYLDTDMEITRDISEFVEKDLFLGVEDSKMINAAVVWAKEAHNPHIQDIVKIYETKKHFNETGDLYDESVPRVLTKYFEQFGYDKDLDEIQTFDNDKVYVYPMEYFYPLSYDYQNNKFTDNSAMIHHFDATWISPMEKFKTKMKRKNMIWVVYTIDFFISLKNKIKFFSNYRDLTIFAAMFLTMLLAMFAISPIENVGVFAGISSKSVWQILGFSLIWTFVAAKIRNVDLNFYMDKLTNVDSDSEEYKPIKLNLEQTTKLQTREKILYVIQFILTVVVAFLPALELVNIIPNNTTIYGLLSIVNMYYVYLGIKKKFKYRILELIPYAIILGLLILLNPSIGILTSIATFGFISYKMISLKVKPKRIKSFVITYAIAIVLFVILSLAVPTINNIKDIDIGTNLIDNTRVEAFDKINENENIITQFNAAKPLFEENIKNSIEDKVLLYPNFYIVLSLVLVILIIVLSKKIEYAFLGILNVLNAIYLMNIPVESMLYISCIFAATTILMFVQILLNKITNEK